jgi:hypothetical protein
MDHVPAIEQLKTQARALRVAMAQDGDAISHAQALELVARSHGYRDWNTIHAAAGNAPRPPVQVGQIVEGRYLGQPFMAEVLGMEVLSEGRYRVTLDLDKAVDVVTFDSFSNFRKRVVKVVDAAGRSPDRTSDGVPHLVVDI